MLHIIWGKIKNNLWLVACLLVGNILLVATVSSIPMYSAAIMQRIFMREMETVQLETGGYPGMIRLRVGSVVRADSESRYRDIGRINEIVSGGDIAADFDAPILSRNMTISSISTRLEAADGRPEDRTVRNANLYAMTGFEENIVIVSGEMYGSAVIDNVIEAVVSEAAFDALYLQIGEVYEVSNIKNPDDRPYLVRISGVFRDAGNDGLYWSLHPSSMNRHLLIDEGLFNELFMREDMLARIEYVTWETAIDYHSLKAADIGKINAAAEKYGRLASDRYYSYNSNFSSVTEGFEDKVRRLDITLWVLEAPIFILLAFFISMVAGQILTLDQNEIAVIKSRGGTRAQVLLIYFGMSAFIALAALAGGVPLGMMVCGMLGASNGFLDFVGRSGLRLELTPLALLLALGTAAFSVATMVIPAIKYSRSTIVGHKSRRSSAKKPAWRRFFLDFVLLAFALYELFSFSNQKEFLADSLADGASIDPLLFLSSSLFMLGAGLIFIRLFSYAVRLIYSAGKGKWPPSLYASFLKVIRSTGEEQFIMIFLVLTLATGVFNARIARTVNLNNEEALRYGAGADIVLMEEWRANAKLSVIEISDSGGVDYKQVVYYEPDYERYSGIEGAESVTKVYTTETGVVTGLPSNTRTQVMGIVSDEFGRTAWMRDGLLPYHFYDYLNALAQNPEAVLVSSHFRDTYGKQLGDRINYRSDGLDYTGVITGFIDYWPGYDPVYTGRGAGGAAVTEPRLLVVANLAHMQRANGIMPYEVWMKAIGGDTSFIYEEAEKSGVLYTKFADMQAELIGAKNNPVFQGTNGVLTVGFIIILAVCTVGFLIYWILSIRSRELQFGIFRAMGLGMGNVIAMLAAEQIMISGSAIIAGVGIGMLTSTLFVPLIQMGYSTGSVLPLIVASDPGDAIRLFIITGVMLAACMSVLAVTVKNIRIAQALKLGED